MVSKDLPLRVKASALGLIADEYKAEMAVDSGYTGIAEIALSADQMSDFYDGEIYDHPQVKDLPVNCGLVITSERGSALGRVTQDKRIKLVRGDRDLFGVHGRSAEQRLAIDVLLDPEVGIVSLGGRAGTCLLYTSPSPRDRQKSRMPSSA